MAETAEERVRLSLLDDDPGLVTAPKVVAAVERIVQLANPLKVVAFGSRARGNHRRDSDLDLAVILRNFDQQRERPPVRRSDLPGQMSIDLLVVGEERHEFMKDSIISVHHHIANEGVTLYDERVGSIDPGAVTRISRRLGNTAPATQ